MAFRSRRTAYYVALVVTTTLVFTVVYNTGMAIWEDRPQPIYRSLEVVVQSFTTTGYGEDAPWQTPQMHGLAILMQLTGIGLILTAVDVFAVPWLRDALSATAPAAITDLEDHIVVCEHSPRTDAFIAELEARNRAYVLIESNDEQARDLHEEGYRVIHGDPESVETLANASLESAAGVVIDAADDASASIALAVRDARPAVRIVTLVEDADLARYHEAAGVDEVLSPRQLLGRSLAGQVPTAVATDVADGVVIGDDFELVELTIGADSELSDERFRETAFRERYGVNVIGAWFDSDFETPVDPVAELHPGTRLLVAGESTQVEALRDATTSTVRALSPQRVVIAGFGDSGQAAFETLDGTGSALTVLDVDPKEHVDVVGDAREPETLQAAGVPDADALIVTVGDDTTATFTTLIARELDADVRIIVRANEETDVEKLYRAGADYVQSLATVSGRMLTSTVFADETVLTYDTRINVVRLPAGRLAGSTLADEAVRTVTDCTVVAVRRDGETITDFDPNEFVFAADDEVVVAGTDDAIKQFEQTFNV